jgi:hypothetical protein
MYSANFYSGSTVRKTNTTKTRKKKKSQAKTTMRNARRRSGRGERRRRRNTRSIVAVAMKIPMTMVTSGARGVNSRVTEVEREAMKGMERREDMASRALEVEGRSMVAKDKSMVVEGKNMAVAVRSTVVVPVKSTEADVKSTVVTPFLLADMEVAKRAPDTEGILTPAAERAMVVNKSRSRAQARNRTVVDVRMRMSTARGDKSTDRVGAAEGMKSTREGTDIGQLWINELWTA